MSLARLRAGVSLRYPGQCLTFLADAEYRTGAWDDALTHSELAVSLAQDSDRTWALAFAHSHAAIVPADRGDWQLAAAHVEASRAAASGAGIAVTNAAWAGAELALARGDLQECYQPRQPCGHLAGMRSPGWADWRPLEVDALIGLGWRMTPRLHCRNSTPLSPPSAWPRPA